MNIIITGHKGLIGSYLKERLLKEGHKIILEIDKKENNSIDILDKIKLKERADIFIHAAAFCKINKTIENPELGYKNGEDTYKVLEFCRRENIPKIVYFSSSRVLNEEKNPYTAGKLFGEELCKAYSQCYGINYLILRPSTVYGPFWDETERLVHIFIVNALKGKDLEIYGNPETKTLDFTYVDDFVEATIRAMNGEWNKECNISGEEEYNIYDLAKYIIQETGSRSQIQVRNKEIAQPQQVKIDISEIKKIGYSPKISICEGIKKTIEWYKNNLKN